MKDHSDYLPMTLGMIDADLDLLEEKGDGDSQMNYLLFLRDEVNKRIKAERAERAKKYPKL